jgi:pimeloyl-ACP methyl ester carboxylesterase
MLKASHQVTVQGRKIEYRRFPGATPDALTIVLLHEGLGSVSMWGSFPARAAHATGCAVVAYSRFGYGHSDARVASYPVEYMHEEAQIVLPELLERLEIAEPILFGHSNGAEIAIIHAGTNERTKGLVVEAPHVFLEDVTYNAIAAAKVAFETTDLPRKLGRHHADAEMAFRGWNDIWLHPDFKRWNIEEYLPRIRCPVLAIQGYDDEYGTMVHIEAIAAQARGPVELVKLAHCGHSPHRDQPQAVLDALAQFVAELA